MIKEKLRIEYTTLFKKLLRQSPFEIKIAFKEVRELFYDSQDHPSLRNHALRNKYAGLRSINVTEDWRAIFKVRENKTQTIIIFVSLGTHKELYQSQAES